MPTNASFRLIYNYAIPNSGAVAQGDTFTFSIPPEVKILGATAFDLRDDDGNLIGTGTLAANGTVVVTFTDYPELYSNIYGKFWFDLKFDADKIGAGHPDYIEFHVGGTTPPFEVEIDFDIPAPLPTSIVKSGTYSYNSSTGNPEITWLITANAENRTVNNAQVVDVISSGLEFIPGSVKVNGTNALPSNYTYAAGTLTYNFPSIITTQQKIEFKTTVSDSEFMTANSQGTTLKKTNTARLNHDGIFVISNQATVNIPVSFLAKTATYNTSTKRIDWTITVNGNGVYIPNAVVTDLLPAGLTLTAGSVLLDGAAFPAAGLNYTHPNLTFTLGEIGESHIIKYSTEVEAAALESNTQKIYSNSAKLTGTGVPGNATRVRNIGVPTSVIRKQGVSYNKQTGEIKWRISVNENKISIQNAVITDLIKPGQEFVPGSESINSNMPGGTFNYVPAAPGDMAKTGTLTYTFSGPITNTYTIEFNTRVTDPSVRESNANTTYTNEAKLTGSNIPESKSIGSQKVESQVIKKTGAGYDYSTRNITWDVVVNSNAMPLSGAIFTDEIPKGMHYVAGSAVISGGADVAGFSYIPAPASDPLKTGTLTYEFLPTINQTYTISFQTHITDLSIFESNEDKTISNSGSLTHSLVPDGVTSSGTQVVKNVVVGKIGKYQPQNTYIDWEVNINSNEITLTDAMLTDQLQSGLALDTSSVKLFRQSIKPDGSLELGNEVTLVAGNVTYDFVSRLFTFTMPTPAVGGYKLFFRTDVTDKTKSPFKNQITFDGTGTIGESSSSLIEVEWQGSGSSGWGEVGSITVNKVDANNHTTKLSGAHFDLIDQYGNVIKQATTGPSGSALFERLRFDINYTVRETVAPTGYLLNTSDYTFMIDGTDTVKNISYNYENEGILGSIRFDKTDSNANPLGGAEFTLYDDELQSVDTTLSATNGEVLFSNVPYGDYTIKETSAPEGYIATTTVLTASIRDDGVTVTASPSSVSNQIIMGDIELLKTGDDGTTPLAGAEFGLYAESDTSFTSSIVATTTGANGKARFENVPYGSYMVKEIAPPEGYLVSGDALPVTVSEHGKTYDLGTVENSLIHGGIEILKINIRNEPLQGAKFALYDATDALVAEAESDAEGKAKFSNIPYGDYYIIETKAPHKYVINDLRLGANIRVQDEVLRFNIVNQRNKLYPWGSGGGNDGTSGDNNTGDSGSAMMLLLFVGSGLVLTRLILSKKRKSTRN